MLATYLSWRTVAWDSSTSALWGASRRPCGPPSATSGEQISCHVRLFRLFGSIWLFRHFGCIWLYWVLFGSIRFWAVLLALGKHHPFKTEPQLL